MPTDDERREAVARLRDMAPGSDWPNYVAEACGMDVSKMSNNFHTFTEQLCQRIADLIEPTDETCEAELTYVERGRGTIKVFECSKCGKSWEQVLADDFTFCPYCGRLIEYADE
jgi:hypothetical protein